MKKLYFAVLLLCAMIILLLFAGCKKINNPGNNDDINGGVKDSSDRKAPKEIKSTEITSFASGFYRWADDTYPEDRSYYFTMDKTEDDRYVIEETNDELSCETDAEFAVKLQELIEEYDLVKNNGISKKTSGLPPEFAPYWMRVNYASGEKLYFSMDGDPSSEWTRAILDLYSSYFDNWNKEETD